MIARFYAYTLTLKAPLLLTALEGDANSVLSLGFIPGSAIRGAVAAPLAAAKDPQFDTVILSGQVCYLNAYPTVDSVRFLPLPTSFRQDKYGDTTYDLAAYSGQSALQDDWPEEQLKGLEAPFLSLDQADVKPGISSVDSRVHQQRYRPKGRAYTHRDPQTNATEERGTIFTYEALEAGQEFRGVIAISGQNQTETDALRDRIKGALGEKVYLGRSRRARYGGEASVTNWSALGEREITGQQKVVTADLKVGDRFRALLTSDYIGRNPESGQIDPSWFKEEVRQRLDEQRVEVLWPRWAFRLVGGYNKKWGLQLPQVLTLRAGSVLVMQALQPIPQGDLLAIEQTGLGERRAEGFGRVVFFEGLQRKPRVSDAPPPPPPDSPTVAAPALVNSMQRRILIDALERQVAQVAADIARLATQIPSPSLLGRLRIPLRGGADAALGTLRQWLLGDDRQRLRRPAMSQLEDCWVKVDEKWQTLAQWLGHMVAGPQDTSDFGLLLGFSAIAQKHSVESKEATEKALLDDSATLLKIRIRLIDEVLALLTRRKRLAARREAHAAN